MTLELNRDAPQRVEAEVSPYPLFDLTLAVTSARTEDDIYGAALTCLHDSLGVSKASILRFDADGVVRFKAWLDLSPEYRAAVEGHTPWTPDTVDPEPVLVPDVRQEASLEHLCPAIEAEGIAALAFFPLCSEGRLLGKFMLYYSEPHELSRQEVLIAQTIAAHVGFALDRQRVRQERREWREHLEGMFRSPVVGFAEIDTEARFRQVNDRFCEIVGRPREELLAGLTCYDVTHPEDVDETASCVTGLLNGDEYAVIDKRYLRPDGATVWVQNSISPLHDEHGQLTGAVAAVTDMTRRRIGEQLRRESEAQLKAELAATQRLQESSSQLIRENDVTTVYETILDAAVELMGSDMASMQMLHPERGDGGELRLIGHRGFSPEAAKHWEWVSATSETTCGEALRTASRVIIQDVRDYVFSEGSKDRETFLDLGIIGMQTTPLISRGGNLIGMISTHWRRPHEPSERDLRLLDVLARQAADLIERTQAEQHLAESNQLIQSITDNMSVGLLLLTEGGAIEMMNPAAERITGYSLSDIKGRILHDVVHSVHLDGSAFDRADCAIDNAARELRELTGHEDVFLRPDGTFYNVVCNVAPLLLDGRRGSVLDLRDATVQKQAELALRESEEQLRAAAELKDEFLGLVSHELRTPISTILGNGLLLSRHWATIPADDRQQALVDISSEAEKLQEIIENLLLITRLEAGKLESEPLSMSRLVEDAISAFQRLHPERQVIYAPALDLAPALGEATLVPLIMRNLLSNADKYSPPGRPIEVSLRFDGEADRLEVAVRDYGIGLDTEDLDSVFEPFFRSKRSRVYAKGMGLGLAVCKRVTEAQDGRIWVEPQQEGSRFVFQLKASPALASDE